MAPQFGLSKVLKPRGPEYTVSQGPVRSEFPATHGEHEAPGGPTQYVGMELGAAEEVEAAAMRDDGDIGADDERLLEDEELRLDVLSEGAAELPTEATEEDELDEGELDKYSELTS